MSNTEHIGEHKVAANKPNQWHLAFDGDLLPARFRSHSLLITSDLVQYICGHTDAPPPCMSARIIRNVVDDILKDRLSSMRQLAEKLDIQQPDDIALLNCVATAMFDDDIVTWGRIITLFAYAGYLARYCHEQGLSECSEAVAELLESIVVNRLGLWILANGGWESFDRQFPAMCFFEWTSVWKAVTVIALMCGAVLAFYSSIQFLNPT